MKRLTLLFLTVAFVATVPFLALATHTPINPVPSFSSPPRNWDTLTETHLLNEDAQRYQHQFDSYSESGGVHAMSGTLTATIPATVAYPGGYYVSLSATTRVYVASLRTFVYVHSVNNASASDFSLSGGTGCSIPASGGIVGHFLFVQCGTTSNDPTVTMVSATQGITPLMRVTTSATAITAVSSFRQRQPYRQTSRGGIPHVMEYGALCDGAQDDTLAFQQAWLVAPLIEIPVGNCMVSNVVISGESSGGAETGRAFGIIGQGVDQSRLTGIAGSTGVMVQVGASTDALVGYRRFRLENLRVVGHSGYTDCIQIGHPGSGGSGVIILGKIERIEVTGCTASGAAGIFLRNVVSLTIDNLYSYTNDQGLRSGTPAGAGNITTTTIRNSQFRVNTSFGMLIYNISGLKTRGNVYESNTGPGVSLVGIGTNINQLHRFQDDWFEANTSANLHINSTYGSTFPAYGTFEGLVFPVQLQRTGIFTFRTARNSSTLKISGTQA